MILHSEAQTSHSRNKYTQRGIAYASDFYIICELVYSVPTLLLQLLHYYQKFLS